MHEILINIYVSFGVFLFRPVTVMKPDSEGAWRRDEGKEQEEQHEEEEVLEEEESGLKTTGQLFFLFYWGFLHLTEVAGRLAWLRDLERLFRVEHDAHFLTRCQMIWLVSPSVIFLF